jgi:hypothetical protein
MFAGMVPGAILIAWAAMSVAIAVAVVWLNKRTLMAFLLADFVLSCMVLSFYLLHEPEVVGFVYYSQSMGGVSRHAPAMTEMNLIDTLSHAAASVIMAVWSLYLANLVQRQRLERQRMVFVLEGEEVK